MLACQLHQLHLFLFLEALTFSTICHCRLAGAQSGKLQGLLMGQCEVTQTPEELKARLLQHCEWNIAELVKGFCVEMPFFSVRKACSLTGTQGGLL